jgi:inorganic phosphate transporter, PiT family
MTLALLILATCFLAYSNGANDNFKGVATLFGSRTTNYRTALIWAAITTGAGGIAAIFLARSLMLRFSGAGLVPGTLTADPGFLLAVALGAGLTVLLATRLGLPISTTHSLTGGLVGSGLMTGVDQVNFGVLGSSYLGPLLMTPIMAVATGCIFHRLLRAFRIFCGINKEMCVCIGAETRIIPVARPNGVFTAEALPKLTLTVDPRAVCHQRYVGRFLGANVGRVVDGMHFLSAGAVGFARGLNDTPKIAGLLLVVAAFEVKWGLVTVAVAMAVGGLLSARRVAETMAHRITDMNAGQGFAANLATSMLVTTASLHGMPVSTTHVSVGSLLGIGITTGQAKWKPVSKILLSWVVTLPCAAAISALTYLILRQV